MTPEDQRTWSGRDWLEFLIVDDLRTMSRRDWIKSIIGSVIITSNLVVDLELTRRTGAGYAEWGRSLLARRGAYEMQKGENLIVFPGAIVTGDIRYYAPDYDLSPLSMSIFTSKPGDLLGEPEGLPEVGNLLVVNSRLRIQAPYGAFVEYKKSDIPEGQFLDSKLRQMSESGNCMEGCKAIVVWRFSNKRGVLTIEPEGAYLSESQTFIPRQQVPQAPITQPSRIPAQLL